MATAPDESDLACYERSGASVCRLVYDNLGGNENLAQFADWLVDRPAKILLAVVGAWILTLIARRWVRRVVSRIIAPPDDGPREVLGFDVPTGLGSTIDSQRRESRANSISAVLTSTVVVTIWTIATIMILGSVGIDLAPLIAGAGIAGVALGFGAQTLVRDCINGFFMLAEDQYGIGDVIDLGEAVGVVEEISLRTTVLRGLDGTVWHVPNGVVQRVGNMSQLWSVALVDVDVAYDTDLDEVTTLFHTAASEVCERDEFVGSVLEGPTVLGVERLGADGVTLRLTVKVDPGTQWALQRAIREHVKSVFDRESVEIPFPQRTVWMRVTPDTPTSPPGDVIGGT